MALDRALWPEVLALPDEVAEWLRLQKSRSRLPGRNDLLVETFPRGGKWFLVAYTFEGRLARLRARLQQVILERLLPGGLDTGNLFGG